MRRFVWTLGLVLAVAAAAGIYWSQTRGAGSAMETADGRTVTVQRGDIVARLAETGALEPMSVIEIKSEQSGEIKKLYVKEGDHVTPGQHLAVIQQESGQARVVAQYRAEFEKERLNLEEARRELDRQKALYDKGFAALKDVEDARKTYEETKLLLDLARRQLLLALGGSTEILNQYLSTDLESGPLDRFIISSPASGTVIEMKVHEGEMITSGTATVGGGTTLVKVADLSSMLVTAKINEVNITSVRMGQSVDIRLDAIPGRTYKGTVTAIAPQGVREDNVVTYEVTIQVENPDEQLKPAMTANVDLVTGTYKDVLYLPIEAVERRDGKDRVRLRNGDATEERTVTLRARTESVAVISEGLKEGDTVAVPGHSSSEES